MQNQTEEKLFLRQSRLMFGQVREDAAVDLFLVEHIPSPNHLFVIASGGCTALTLLSVDSCKVDALDISEAQIALVELKQVLLKHLGFRALKDACLCDAQDLFKQVMEFLSPRTREILSAKTGAFKNGLNNSGWVDQRMHQLTKLFYLFVHNKRETEKFLRLESVEAQKNFYLKNWSNWQWRMTLKIAFSRAFLALAHGRAAERLVPDDFSSVMEKRLVRALTDFPNATNPYLWQAFFAKYNSLEAGLPPYLQQNYAEQITANIDHLNLVCDDTISWLAKQPPSSINYFGLSNILELLPAEYASNLQTEIVRVATPGAIVCVRAIFQRRSLVFEEIISTDTARGLAFDEALSLEAEKRDRSLFCNFYQIYRCS